jgi:putative lipoprotein
LAKALLVFGAAAGCASARPEGAGTGESPAIRNLTGIVTCRERTVLARDVMVRLELLDVSGKDGPTRTVVMQEIEPAGRQFPIPFVIPYNQGTIDPERTYALRVRVYQGRHVLFRNTAVYNVITNGVRNNIEVVVESAPGSGGGPR